MRERTVTAEAQCWEGVPKVGSSDHLEKARKDRSTASLMMMFVGFLRGARKRRVGSQLGIIVQARPVSANYNNVQT